MPLVFRRLKSVGKVWEIICGSCLGVSSFSAQELAPNKKASLKPNESSCPGFADFDVGHEQLAGRRTVQNRER